MSIVILASALCACDSESELPKALSDEKIPLEVSVTANAYPEQNTKGMITGNTLTSGSIGVKVIDAGGTTYDGLAYNNVPYSYADSKWGPTSGDILLSQTSGTAYAYYPYADGTDIRAINITSAADKDYMYSDPITVSNVSNSAAFQMYHAMTGITITLNNGTYTGTGTVTSLKWNSVSAATAGTLNVQTKSISGQTGGGTDFDAGLNATNTQSIRTSKTYSFMAVPTTNTGTVNFTVVMDGQTYTCSSGNLTFVSGTKYNFTLTMDSKTLSVSAVNMTDWEPSNQSPLKPTF